MDTPSVADDPRVERLRRQLVVLSESMRAFAEATSDYRNLLQTIVTRAALAVGGFCAIGLPSGDGQWLEIVAAFDADPAALDLIRQVLTSAPIRLDSPHVTTQVFTTGEPSLVPQVDEDFLARRFTAPEPKELVRQLRVGSHLLVALRLHGESLGILSLLRHGTGVPVLDEDDVRLAQALADHAALAIAKSRLLESLQRELAERKRAEEALGESEARLRQIVETATEGIWVTDAERRTTYVNHSMAQMLREHPEHLLGRSALEFVPREDHPRSDARMVRRRAGIAEQFDVRLKRKDGSSLEAHVSASSMVDASGRFLGSVALVTDATERKSLEEQLRQAQKMEAVGRLAGGVAHDFNNALSVVLSIGELLTEEFKPSDPIRQDLEDIVQAGRRAAALTRQLLAFSRQQVLEPIPLNPNEIVRGMEKMVGRLIGEDIELEVVTEANLHTVVADPGQLEQVLLNLVVNARDAMPQGGRLLIETANVHLDGEYTSTHLGVKSGDYAMLAVSDTGAGMTKEVQARIFEPFFTTKEKGKGTGLGLSMVYGIVKQSGGHVWVYSEPGQGATFKVYLPRSQARSTTSSVPPPVPDVTRLSGSETVLLVEDDEQVRTVARNILRKSSYTVLEAANAGEALLICEQHPSRIHLLLTDVVMPQMSGVALAQRLVASRPGMRALCMSGYTDEAVLRHGLVDSGLAFLQKPLTPESLLLKVRQVLDRV